MAGGRIGILPMRLFAFKCVLSSHILEVKYNKGENSKTASPRIDTSQNILEKNIAIVSYCLYLRKVIKIKSRFKTYIVK